MGNGKDILSVKDALKFSEDRLVLVQREMENWRFGVSLASLV
jgi:hypothetical protein